MKTRTVTEHIGEHLGPIDWSFFESEKSGSLNPATLEAAKERLRQLEADPTAFVATTDGGWPRVGWKEVLRVGMYDGWPYWRPYPSVQIAGTLGPEWHSYHSITDIERKPARRERDHAR